MICIILHKPLGDGTYQSVIGFSTLSQVSIVDTLGATVVCEPGWLPDGAISELTSQIDISQARGNVSQGIRGTIEIVDHDGTQRRSVDILNGNNRFAGWAVSYYVSADGSVPTTPINGAWAFAITNVAVNATSITLDVVSRWALDGRTVGFGADKSQVGLVMGGSLVSVKTQGLQNPVAIEYQSDTGWYSSSPNTPQQLSGPQTHATSKGYDSARNAYGFNFLCFPGTAFDFYARIMAGDARITGSKYSQAVSVAWVSSNTVGVLVPREFYDNEEPSDVSIFSVDAGTRAIIGGADSLKGFISESGAIVNPLGDVSISADGVVNFSASLTAPDGFIAYTLIPCSVAFSSGWTPQSLGGTNEISYYGSTSSINTDGTHVPDWESLNSDLIPNSPQSQFAARIKWYLGAELILPLRLHRLDDDVKYDRYEIDARTKWTAKALLSAPYIIYADKQEPYSKKGVVFDAISIPPGSVINYGVRELQGPGTYDPDTSFLTFDEINSLPASFCGLIIRSTATNELVCTWQISALRLYGVSVLKFGSSYAVIQPGASPWWNAPQDPASAALAMLQSTGAYPALLTPGLMPAAEEWGEFVEPDKTIIDACAALCEEFWTILASDGATHANGTGDGELIEAPTFTLGALEDVVTEFSIKYDSWNGDFRKTAFVAHVDEEFDGANPSRYYGGWGVDDDHDYGMEIWTACRNAWKVHGLKRSASFEAPGVHTDVLMGRMWTAARNGAMRCQWLSLQPRYMTFKIRESRPTWWAGSGVVPPQTMAAFQGYDLSAYTHDQLICTSKSYDLETMISTYELALPPVLSTGVTDRIVQTLDAAYPRIVQSLSTSDDQIVQILEA